LEVSLLLIIIFTVRELALPSLLKAYGSGFVSVVLLEMRNDGFLGETAALSFVLIVFITPPSVLLKKLLKTSFLV
jgi:ABC-type Fe3+ transport system permease subunit